MEPDPKDKKEEKPPPKDKDTELEDDASKLFFGDHLKNVVDKDLQGGSEELDLPHESPSMQFFGESLDEDDEKDDEDNEGDDEDPPPDTQGDPEVEEE